MALPRVPSEEFVMVSRLGDEDMISNSWDDDSVSDSGCSEDIVECSSTQPSKDLPNTSSKEQQTATSVDDLNQQDLASDGPSNWSSSSFMVCAPSSPSNSEDLSLNTNLCGHKSRDPILELSSRKVPVTSGNVERAIIEPRQPPAASRVTFVPFIPVGKGMHEAVSTHDFEAAHLHNQLHPNGSQTSEAENRKRKSVDLQARIASLEKAVDLINLNFRADFKSVQNGSEEVRKSRVMESQLSFQDSYVATDEAKVAASSPPDAAVKHWPEKAAQTYLPVMTSYGRSLMPHSRVRQELVDSFAKSLKGQLEPQGKHWEIHQNALVGAEKVQHDRYLAVESFADQLPCYTGPDDQPAVIRLRRLGDRSTSIKNSNAAAEVWQLGQVEASRYDQTERRSDSLLDAEVTSGRYARVVDSPQCRDSGLARADGCQKITCGRPGSPDKDGLHAHFKAHWGPYADRSGLGAKPTFLESWLCSWGLLELAPRLESIGWTRLLSYDRESLTTLLQIYNINESGMLIYLLEEIKKGWASESQSFHARSGWRRGTYFGPIPDPSLTPGEGDASVDGTAMHSMRETPSLMPGPFPGDDSLDDTAPKDDRCLSNQSNRVTYANSIHEITSHVHGHGNPLPKARRLTHGSQIHPATRYEPFDKDVSAENIFRDGFHAARPRYVNWLKPGEIMLVTNGTCTFEDAGRLPPTATAGASFIFDPTSADIPAFRLETQGPEGDVQPHTSNRAKLRAALAALEARPWTSECWDRVVVVTDLEYVARGATEWIPLWAKRRWRSAPGYTKEGMFLGKKIANRDLWEQLQARVDALRERGTDVAFWLVKEQVAKELLRKAKRAAREAATTGAVMETYTKTPVVC